jgi:RNA recognition motif-containing protein
MTEGLSLFVGDIGPDVTVDDLREAFQTEDMAVTDARIVMDPASGRTKGYGFVTFCDSHAAEKALVKDGEILKGRKMRVNWAVTTKDQQQQKQLGQYIPGTEFIPPVIRNEFQIPLYNLAQMEGLDVQWYMSLPAETQAGILRVSQEAPGAKIIWIGNIDKATTRTA